MSGGYCGFVDFGGAYEPMEWYVAGGGGIICFATLLSFTLQALKMIQRRTAFGLSGIMVAMVVASSFMGSVAPLCEHVRDLDGCFQLPARRTFPRFFASLTQISNWLGFVWAQPLCIILFDDHGLVSDTVGRAWHLELLWVSLTVIVCWGLYVVFMAFGASKGFGSAAMSEYGGVATTMASVVIVLRNLPQFYQTWTLWTPGSVSLLLLFFQGFGGLITCAFMIWGGNERWTVWVPSFVATLMQLLLWIFCVFVKCRPHKTDATTAAPLLSTTEHSPP